MCKLWHRYDGMVFVTNLSFGLRMQPHSSNNTRWLRWHLIQDDGNLRAKYTFYPKTLFALTNLTIFNLHEAKHNHHQNDTE